jgi:allantoicase
MDAPSLAAFKNLVNLAAQDLGTQVVFANDDFFAEKENLIKAEEPVFLPDEYTERGKWMDGWESRRKRDLGFDRCVIKLGLPGTIKAVNIDTRHFLGNHPAFASVDAAKIDTQAANITLGEDKLWQEILPQVPLLRGSPNLFAIEKAGDFTHVRLNIFPDGGVARFRVYGDVVPKKPSNEMLDLAGLVNGGKVVGCNDMFFGDMHNLIKPHPGVNMGDGWETRRKRDWSEDWLVVKLGQKGMLQKITLSTAHFIGNYPKHFSLDGIEIDSSKLKFYDGTEQPWVPILTEKALGPNEAFDFDGLQNKGPFTHVRIRIFPDGGVSRLRVMGKVVE